MEELNREQFFQKYNINKEDFEVAGLDWESLLQIYNDYLTHRKTLIPTSSYIADILRTHPDAHTVRTRIKDPEHLLDKIIRKTIREKGKDSNYKIDIKIYKTEITDLIGIRVLHLYKDQAAHIDRFIRESWHLKEKCTINYREGDYSKKEEHEDNELFEFKVHEAGYRSWHYLIGSQVMKEEHISEIQVRTIFEEGWSEIDHQLRYPNDTKNELHTKQLLVLNRVAGSADEMANAIRETKINITQLISENQKSSEIIKELTTQLDSVLKENKVAEKDKEELKRKIKELEKSLTITIPKQQSYFSGSSI